MTLVPRWPLRQQGFPLEEPKIIDVAQRQQNKLITTQTADQQASERDVLAQPHQRSVSSGINFG